LQSSLKSQLAAYQDKPLAATTVSITRRSLGREARFASFAMAGDTNPLYICYGNKRIICLYVARFGWGVFARLGFVLTAWSYLKRLPAFLDHALAA
jgi:hypothetical protein